MRAAIQQSAALNRKELRPWSGPPSAAPRRRPGQRRVAAAAGDGSSHAPRLARAARRQQAPGGPRRNPMLPPPPGGDQSSGSSGSSGNGGAEQDSAKGALSVAEQQQLWNEVERLVGAAEAVEAAAGEGAAGKALAMVLAGLEQLQQQHGYAAFPLTALRQMAWDLLYASGRHAEALQQIGAAHQVVAAHFGAQSSEAHMLGVRLGMSLAACGRLGEGLKLIYDATPVLDENMQTLLLELSEEAGERPMEEAQALQDAAGRVAAALGEGNFYGSLLTLRSAVAQGQQEGVVLGWEELDDIMANGFAAIVATAGGAGTGGAGGPAHALREHDALTRELGSDALLARLLQAQNERLHRALDDWLESPPLP